MKRETRSVWLIVAFVGAYAFVRLWLADHEREKVERVLDVDRLRRGGL